MRRSTSTEVWIFAVIVGARANGKQTGGGRSIFVTTREGTALPTSRGDLRRKLNVGGQRTEALPSRANVTNVVVTALFGLSQTASRTYLKRLARHGDYTDTLS